jgi:glycosyltransferase involved in cell wall biosynthesis
MKIAITTDWLVTMGGAERVIEQMLEVWPEAELFTTVCKQSEFPQAHTTFLQHQYNIIGSHRPLIFQMPRAVESWDLSNFDVILSSSHAVAKGCIPPSSAMHICYCHTPMRWAWEMEEQYLKDFKVPALLRPIVKRKMDKLRRWDLTTAKRVDLFIANSRTVQERIKRIYGRDSVVLHPPVDDRFFRNEELRIKNEESYYLTVGRLVPYKRFDIPIEAANRMGFNLKVVGEGPEEKRLKKLAGPTVEMLGRVSEDKLLELYAGAKGFIFPTFEDAGIVPLESQACGTPVIAYGKGGALDTVIDGKTGIFFKEQNADSLLDAINKFESIEFDPKALQEHATKFSSSNFRKKLEAIVTEYCVQSTRA